LCRTESSGDLIRLLRLLEKKIDDEEQSHQHVRNISTVQYCRRRHYGTIFLCMSLLRSWKKHWLCIISKPERSF